MNDLPASFKKKPVLIALGVGAAIVVLYALARSSGSTPTVDSTSATLTSQSLANQYNIAALGYQATLANDAAANHAADVSANTAIALHVLDNTNNIATVNGNIGLQQIEGAQAIKINADNAAANIDLAKLNEATTITLAPTMQAIAQINANADVAKAGIASSAATTIANLNAATAQKGISAGTTQSLISNAGGLVNAAGGLSSLFGGAGGASSLFSGGSSALDLGALGGAGESAGALDLLAFA